MALKRTKPGFLLSVLFLSLLVPSLPSVFSEEDPRAVLEEARSHLHPSAGVWVILSPRTQEVYPALAAAAGWFPNMLLDDEAQVQATVRLGDQLKLNRIYYYGTEEEVTSVKPRLMSFLGLAEEQFVPHPLIGEYPEDLLAQIFSGLSGQPEALSLDWKQLIAVLNSRPQPSTPPPETAAPQVSFRRRGELRHASDGD